MLLVYYFLTGSLYVFRYTYFQLISYQICYLPVGTCEQINSLINRIYNKILDPRAYLSGNRCVIT